MFSLLSLIVEASIFRGERTGVCVWGVGWSMRPLPPPEKSAEFDAGRWGRGYSRPLEHVDALMLYFGRTSEEGGGGGGASGGGDRKPRQQSQPRSDSHCLILLLCFFFFLI